MHTWNSPAGPLTLGRHPYDQDEPALFAWNGADILLVRHALEAGSQLRVLVLNDSFGALACALRLAGYEVRWQSDSFIAGSACRRNLADNGLDPGEVVFLDSLTWPDVSDWAPDLVLMQLPKSKLMLEFQLGFLAASLPAGTPVCAGGMTRDIHDSTSRLFERLIGPCCTSLASHKARLVHATLSGERQQAALAAAAGVVNPGGGPPERNAWPRVNLLDEPGLPELEICSHAGVFSAAGHDAGSIFLLQWLADSMVAEAVDSIVDCGCGNGLLALTAARLFPGATLLCTDESFMAVESARAGFLRNDLAGRASFAWTDCLQGVGSDSADLVLCNPPFHQVRTQTLAVALRMFSQAAGVLRPNGYLVVVANRHLGYRRHLEKLFPLVRIAADDGRYQVIVATKADRKD